MDRTLSLFLNNFDPIPQSLQDYSKHHTKTLKVNLDALFHHMFLDTYDETPPMPNYLGEHYKLRLTSDPELRFRGAGLGSHKEVKIGESNKFGKAFCRWFLSTHCSMTYFEHMDRLLGGHVSLDNGFRVKRVDRGDTPDYLCCKGNQQDKSKIFFGEAKGTQTLNSISFEDDKFKSWRDQFSRVSLFDRKDTSFWVKGYIVATYLANESYPSYESQLFAEDPLSAGENSPSEAEGQSIKRALIAFHYASIFDRLRLPLLATALRQSIRIPESARFQVGLWRGRVPPVERQEFIGGYFLPPQPYDIYSSLTEQPYSRLNLSLTQPLFFGVHRKIFLMVRDIISQGREAADRVVEISEMTNYESNGDDQPTEGLSLLRDGSVLAPLDYFELVEVIEV